MSLSVIIPARNAGETLGQALDSLLAQTRGDWQAIVVDDGSTDGTVQLAQSYVARDARFRLLSDGRTAQGASAARNRGIAEAQGKWLLFLDSDDWVLPTFVQEMLGALEGTAGARLAYCGYRRITPGGQFGPVQWSAAVAHSAYSIFARQCEIAIHSCVVDRALAIEVGGFDSGLQTCEDWEFWLRIARTGIAFLPVPRPLAVYRIRGDSLTSNVDTLLADAATVLDRADATATASVASGPSRDMAFGYFALWCAARVVGGGGDGTMLVRPLPDHHGDVAEACRHILLDGLMVGACASPDTLLLDPGFLDRLRALLARIEQAATRPGFSLLLEFALEPDLSPLAPLTWHRVAGTLLLVRQDIADLQMIEGPDGIDSIHVEFRRDRQALSRIDVPAFGALSRREVTALALEVVSLATFAGANRLVANPRFWLHAMSQTLRIGMETIQARRERQPVPARTVKALARSVTRRANLAMAPGTASANEAALARLIAEARAGIEPPTPQPAPAAANASSQRQRGRHDRWEEVFAAPDPWSYDSPYEQLKYQRTLGLLPAGPIGTAMEVACAEGHFTTMLAARVDRLIASDISATALARARTRCRDRVNIDFQCLDLIDDSLPDNLDLLVCSEVLYFLPDVAALRRTGARLIETLRPGGRLLTAHAFVANDDRDCTSYDWEHPFGGKVIGETLGTLPGLALERSLRTELYRIDLFRRLIEGEPAPEPVIETLPLGPPPEAEYARHILWNGTAVRRAEAQARETADRLPILMYHRIADEGPTDLARWRLPPRAFAEQMRWLRRHGYHAVTSNDLLRHRAGGYPFPGRPILISFDDGYRDFHEQAWPILRANDLTAEMFIVTDLVGDAAHWDAKYGPPAPLMDWSQIQELAAEGVRFGSHLASHAHMATLSNRQILAEAARSRALLERATGQDCLSIAAPFGEGDDRFVRIARSCGYRTAFTTEPGFARLTDDAWRLPRIEVMGDWSLDTFAKTLRPNP